MIRRMLAAALPLLALAALVATPRAADAARRVIRISDSPGVIIVRGDDVDRHDAVALRRWVRGYRALARAEAARSRVRARAYAREIQADELRDMADELRARVRDRIRWGARDRRERGDELRMEIRDRLRDLGRIRVRGEREWSI